MVFRSPGWASQLVVLLAGLLLAGPALASTCTDAEWNAVAACTSGEADACTDGLRKLGDDEGQLFCATVTGCEKGVEDACVALANWLAKDEPLPRDLPPAQARLAAACDAHGLSCPVLAAAEGRTGSRGEPTERIRRAADWRIRACKKDVDCVLLAAMWEEGKLPASLLATARGEIERALQGNHADKPLVAKVWQRAQLREQQCDQGSREACEFLAKAAATAASLDGGDPAVARLAPLQRGCKAGECMLCDQLASAALTRGAADAASWAVEARRTCGQSCQNHLQLLGKKPSPGDIARLGLTCRRAAHWLTEPAAGELAPALALDVLQPVCQRQPAACSGLAWLALATQLPADAATKALGLLETALRRVERQPAGAELCRLVGPIPKVTDLRARCAGADAAACSELVRRHPDALTVAEASSLLRRGCEAGDGGQCARLIWLAQMVGVWAVPAAQLDSVVAAAKKGCDAGDGEACFLLGYRAARDGKPAEALCKQASLQLDSTCRTEGAAGRGSACIVLAQIYSSGFCGDIADADLARWAAGRACELGEAAGCSLMARYRNADGADREAVRDVRAYLLRACQLGDADACLTLRGAPIRPGKDKAAIKQANDEASGLASACKAGQRCACGGQ